MMLRAQVEVEIAGVVCEHEAMREALHEIERLFPGAHELTLGVRQAMIGAMSRVSGIRVLLGAATMCGEPDRLKPGLQNEEADRLKPGLRTAMRLSLHRAGDDFLDEKEGYE